MDHSSGFGPESAAGSPHGGGGQEPTGDPAPLVIDCDACVMQHTEACDDCVVTFLCNREPDEAVIIPVSEARALRALHDAGLVPALRHSRRTG